MSGQKRTCLLEEIADPGYPLDYLLSRVRSRRSQLVRDWARLLDEDIVEYLSSGRLRGITGDPLSLALWQRLVGEFRWVYSQMNGSVRGAFCPFFLYTELRTIFICMRHGGGGNLPGVEKLLSLSLLCRALKTTLASGDDAASVARRVESAFTAMSGDFQGVAGGAKEHDLREFEIQLTERYLSFACRFAEDAFMRRFFARLIDARNLIKAYKSLRLNAKLRPQWIEGGSIPGETLNDIVRAGDMFAILPLIRRHTGSIIATPDISRVEGALYSGISRFLRTEAGDPLHAATLLDYLWRFSLETTNLNLLLHGRDVPRDVMSEELVH